MKDKIGNKLSLSKQTVRKKPQKKSSEVKIKTRTLIDQKTGELIETTEIEHKATDINFDKIFLGHIISAMEMIGNKKIKLLMFLFAVKNSDNQIIMTQREIAKESKISLRTVSETLQALQVNDFLIMKSPSVYVINPNMLFKGSANKRMNILLSYQEVQSEQQLTRVKKETQIGENPDTFIQTKEEG